MEAKWAGHGLPPVGRRALVTVTHCSIRAEPGGGGRGGEAAQHDPVDVPQRDLPERPATPSCGGCTGCSGLSGTCRGAWLVVNSGPACSLLHTQVLTV